MTAAPDVINDDDLPRAFGGYLLLRNFARGGMGDVYLAKSGGIAGLERMCVLKKLRSELTRDREYVTRFIDEARVVVTLNHRNICNVFDVGRVDNEYYLAMEYVSGRDLRAVQDRCRKRETTMPAAAVLYLTCEVLEALDYAHRRRHPVTQEPLNLIHRDISPQNVLVSYEGEVKLIDFGLAASRLKVERTQPNVVMGKMAYMPPEQARGDAIDSRVDLFACGVLAYELLTNERFYEGMSAQDIWQIAGRGGFIPRAWSTLDPALASILARALHPEARRRYPTCGDFRDALSAYVHERHPGAGARGLRQWMGQLFEEEVARERAQLSHFGAVTVASVTDPVETTRSQAVSLAGDQSAEGPLFAEDPDVAEASSRYDARMPPPMTTAQASTDEGTPLRTAKPHDDPTLFDAERPEAATDPQTSPADPDLFDPPAPSAPLRETRTRTTNAAQRSLPALAGEVPRQPRPTAAVTAPSDDDVEGTARVERRRRVAESESDNEREGARGLLGGPVASTAEGEVVTALELPASRRRLVAAVLVAVVVLLLVGVALLPAAATTSPPEETPPPKTMAATGATPTDAPLPAATDPLSSTTVVPPASGGAAAMTSPTTTARPPPTTAPTTTAQTTTTPITTPSTGSPRRTTTTGPRSPAPRPREAAPATAPAPTTTPGKTSPSSSTAVTRALWERLLSGHANAPCVRDLMSASTLSRATFFIVRAGDIKNCALSLGMKP